MFFAPENGYTKFLRIALRKFVYFTILKNNYLQLRLLLNILTRFLIVIRVYHSCLLIYGELMRKTRVSW